MPRVSPIQESFAAGEIGQRVRGRVSTDAYKQGLAECLNWYPLVQGPLRMRPGSQFVTQVDDSNWVSGEVGTEGIKVFTFDGGIDEDLIVEVGDDDIVVRDSNTGNVITGGTSGNLIPDSQFATVGIGVIVESAVWYSDLDADIHNTDPGRHQYLGADNGTVRTFMIPPSDPSTQAVQMKMNTDGAPNGAHGVSFGNKIGSPVNIPAGSELLLNEFSFIYYQFTDNPGTNPLDPPPWADPRLTINIGTAPGLSDVFTTDVTIGPTSSYNNVTISFTPGGGNNVLYFEIVYRWDSGVVPDLPTGLGDDGKGLAINVGALSWVAPLAGGSGSDIIFTSPYTREQLECLQVAMDPGEQVMFFTHPEVETQRLRRSDVNEWTFAALSAITLPTPFQAPTPNNWAAGNYPAACAFHEGRLWLGGSPSDPATLWASESGDYVNFNNVAPATKADPLLFPISNSGRIQTLTSRKELVINFDISETIGDSDAGPIAFDDFEFPKQTDWGSNCIQPIVVGREMVFTSNSRKRLRTFADIGGTRSGYDGNEISLLAQDIFSQPVRKMVYLDEPAYQACFLLADGTMGMATYFYPENVIGWWRFQTAYNGDRTYGDETQPGLPNQSPNTDQPTNCIMDITKINTSEGAKLWMVVNRVGFAGTQKPFHEVLSFEDPALTPFVGDCSAARTIDTSTKTINGIDFLTDQSINCVIQRLVDPQDPNSGFTYTVHPNITAIAGVSSELEDWAVATEGNNALVGLLFDNNWKLLPTEGVSNRGTAQVSKRRWNQIYLRLNNSSVPLVNGEPPKDRTPGTPMGTGEPIITDDVEYTELGSLEQGQLNILQDRPLAAEVLAIFGKVASREV